jgi:hypothetical protein
MANGAIVRGLNDNSDILADAVKTAAHDILTSAQSRVKDAVKLSIDALETRFDERIIATVGKVLTENNEQLVKLFGEEQNAENSGTQMARRILETQVKGLEALLKTQAATVANLMQQVEKSHTETKAVLVDFKAYLEQIEFNIQGYNAFHRTTIHLLQRVDFLIEQMGYTIVRGDADQVSSIRGMECTSIHVLCQSADASDNAAIGDDAADDGGAPNPSGIPDGLPSFSLEDEVREVAPFDKGKGKASNITGELAPYLIPRVR